jgi:Putative peptidoglycan binding domain
MSIDETQEPTLRQGDESADGWVEYLQEVLTLWLEPAGYGPLTRSGTFDDYTHNAVIWFQGEHHLLVDGVVGNQTWAALRGETPQAVGTDGRAPGTFVDTGLEARWILDDHSARHDASRDTLFLAAVSTGTDVINGDNFAATGWITTAAGEQKQIVGYFLDEDGDGQAGPGENFFLAVPNASQEFGVGDITVEVEMDKSLGGDQMHTTVSIVSP